jgi:hypothetical protein
VLVNPADVATEAAARAMALQVEIFKVSRNNA